MKHLQGKKLKVNSINGMEVFGLVTGATDELIKILIDTEKDETVILIKNIFTYKIVGEGVSGGFSGLKVFCCKNEEIGCKGRRKLSTKNVSIEDMGCEVCNAKTVAGTGFKCDFGCIGDMEVIPSNAQRVLFDGMLVEANKPKGEINNGK